MRTSLGTTVLSALALALALTSCGEERSGTGTDPGAPSWEQVALIEETAARGVPDTGTVRLDDEADVTAFVAELPGGEIERGVRKAWRDAQPLAEGESLHAAVVSVGCDTPDSVAAEIDGDRVTIVPVGLVESGRQCIAAITTVGVVKVTSTP